MSDEKFELSRRNALIGLGTVGVASAGAGIGTSAFYNDQVSAQNNTIQAGTFSLSVGSETVSVDQGGLGPDEDSAWTGSNINITDAKPGDEYEFCWDITIHGNPGYVSVAANVDTNQTGAQAGNVNASDVFNVSSDSDFITLAQAAVNLNVTLNGPGVSADYDYNDNLQNLLDDLKSGALLRDDNGNVIQFSPGDTYTLCIEFDIPDTMGNQLQGAVLEWDTLIYAEQARHNNATDVKNASVNAV